MEMDIQIRYAAGTLDQRNGAGAGRLKTGSSSSALLGHKAASRSRPDRMPGLLDRTSLWAFLAPDAPLRDEERYFRMIT
jgi:hypothetical protein